MPKFFRAFPVRFYHMALVTDKYMHEASCVVRVRVVLVGSAHLVDHTTDNMLRQWRYNSLGISTHMLNIRLVTQLLQVIMWYLLAVLLIGWLAGCTISNVPAKQQNFSASLPTSATVAQLDTNQDGTITTQEAQVLHATNNHASWIFLSIVCCVIVTCVAAGVMSRRKTRQSDQAPTSSGPDTR